MIAARTAALTAQIVEPEKLTRKDRAEINEKYRQEVWQGVSATLAQNIESDRFSEKEAQVGLRASYQKSGFWGATVSLFLAGEFSNLDRDSQAGLLDIEPDLPQHAGVNLGGPLTRIPLPLAMLTGELESGTR